MQNLNSNYINKFKSPNLNTCVILDGIYQPNLSDNYEEGVTFEQQTIKISANTKIKKPIHLLFITSQNCTNTINIIASTGSNFDIIEEHTSLKNHSYINDIKINIVAENSSKIVYYKLHNENSTAIHNAYTNIKQKQNSKVVSRLVGGGNKITNDILHIELIEKNASYNALGIISLCDTQNLNYQTRIDHLAQSCTSNILFKGIVTDKAIGNFNSLVAVQPGATKTETHVTNKNLLLSESATITTSPELEIYTDNVICTHGATVGQLDKESIFYLRSRGINENLAIQLLILAFTYEIIDQFADYCKQKINRNITYEY